MIEPDPPALAAELRLVIGQLLRRLRAEREGDRLGGLTLSQMAVLGWLDRDGPAGISALATAERVRPQSMAATVAALGTAGLVRRSPDPADGRRVIIELTPTGTDAIRADRRRREDWLAEAIGGELTARDRETLARAVGLLTRIVESP